MIHHTTIIRDYFLQKYPTLKRIRYNNEITIDMFENNIKLHLSTNGIIYIKTTYNTIVDDLECFICKDIIRKYLIENILT